MLKRTVEEDIDFMVGLMLGGAIPFCPIGKWGSGSSCLWDRVKGSKAFASVPVWKGKGEVPQEARRIMGQVLLDIGAERLRTLAIKGVGGGFETYAYVLSIPAKETKIRDLNSLHRFVRDLAERHGLDRYLIGRGEDVSLYVRSSSEEGWGVAKQWDGDSFRPQYLFGMEDLPLKVFESRLGSVMVGMGLEAINRRLKEKLGFEIKIWGVCCGRG